MLSLKRIRHKKTPSKKDREKTLLFGLVDLYIKTSTPVGSNTLRDSGFGFLSSATIRNYFSKLEKKGYLSQQHFSSGRIPTTKAYREYVNDFFIDDLKIAPSNEKILAKQLKKECKKLKNYLYNGAEKLSELCDGCVFLTTPSFDQDFIHDIKLVSLEDTQILCVIITDFGQIKTEVLSLEKRVNEKDLKQLEQFLLWRISKTKKPNLSESLTKIAQKLYNEIMLRHVASYSTKTEENTFYRTGLSKLLMHREFQDPTLLANSLSLFEDFDKIKSLLNESIKINKLTCWIGSELRAFGSSATECSIIAIPYRINQIPVGAVAILLPKRVNYSKIFGIAKMFSEYVSEALTKSIYKFKINFQPSMDEVVSSTSSFSIMLEDKSKI